MNKGVLGLLIVGVFLLSVISAASVDDEFQKVTHYAEEYEIGNINYAQLLVHVASAREGLNQELGATGQHMGGVVKQEQIESILGEPTEETKWVWVEGEDHDTKLDDYVPAWRKIIFDGSKIQISLEAFPSIFKKRAEEEEFEEGQPEDLESREDMTGEIIGDFDRG